MLKQLRQMIVAKLWHQYRNTSSQMKSVEQALLKKNVGPLFLDHFAMIDLPGPQTGIPFLRELFSMLGFIEQGKDYLADKQNDFLWMTESDSEQHAVTEVLPQVVIADFRLEELPIEIKKIIEKYAKLAPNPPLNIIKKLIAQGLGPESADTLCRIILDYFAGRDWPLPTTQEFYTVQEFNELLAWVLVFGRKPNHFTLSIHLLNYFTDLTDFSRFIVEEAKLAFNHEGGIIKGSPSTGIAQCSTIGLSKMVPLANGPALISTEFVEFVWRFPKEADGQQPTQWKDYFTGFIAQHADRVIESLYAQATHC